MRSKLSLIILLLVISSVFLSCKKDKSSEFVTTELGFSFKHCIDNKDNYKAKQGDILYGEMEIRVNDSVKLYSNYGKPERLFSIIGSDKGTIDEFLLNLHVGDSAIIIIPADSASKYASNLVLRHTDKVYFYLKIQQIISKKEISQEDQLMIEQQQKEFDTIEQYIQKKSLKAEKQESGLYFINQLEGVGEVPKYGDEVFVNYSVSTLDGKIVDSNIKTVAQTSGIYSKDRTYEPFSFVLGDEGLIAGWTQGITLMKKGGKAKLIIPSKLGYGQNSYGPIKPNSVLIFDITLINIVRN